MWRWRSVAATFPPRSRSCHSSAGSLAHMSREFADRHIGPSAAEIEAMLAARDVETVDELIDQTVPESIRDRTPLALPPGLSEADALTRLHEIAGKNQVLTSLIGMGYANTVTPPVIQRNVLEDP